MLALGIACMFLAGCADSGAPGPTGAEPSYEVRASALKGLGQILVDGRDYALYAYVPDGRGPSRCAGVCATEWPPLILPRGVSRPKAGPGVSPALLGTARRANGSVQVTYRGWPLYLYENDRAPDEVTGQGDDMGLWFVVHPDGGLDRQLPPDTTRG